MLLMRLESSLLSRKLISQRKFYFYLPILIFSKSNPNIVSYKEAFFIDNPSALCIVMEYADGGDLYDKICEHKKKGSKFSEAEIWEIFI